MNSGVGLKRRRLCLRKNRIREQETIVREREAIELFIYVSVLLRKLEGVIIVLSELI